MGRASAASLLLGPKPGAEKISPPPNLGALLIGQSRADDPTCPLTRLLGRAEAHRLENFADGHRLRHVLNYGIGD
jgi:hypothetical protein